MARTILPRTFLLSAVVECSQKQDHLVSTVIKGEIVFPLSSSNTFTETWSCNDSQKKSQARLSSRI